MVIENIRYLAITVNQARLKRGQWALESGLIFPQVSTPKCGPLPLPSPTLKPKYTYIEPFLSQCVGNYCYYAERKQSRYFTSSTELQCEIQHFLLVTSTILSFVQMKIFLPLLKHWTVRKWNSLPVVPPILLCSQRCMSSYFPECTFGRTLCSGESTRTLGVGSQGNYPPPPHPREERSSFPTNQPAFLITESFA